MLAGTWLLHGARVEFRFSCSKHFTHRPTLQPLVTLEKFFPPCTHLTRAANLKMCRADNLYSLMRKLALLEGRTVSGHRPSLGGARPFSVPWQDSLNTSGFMRLISMVCRRGFRGWLLGVRLSSAQRGWSVVLPPALSKSCHEAQAGLELTILLLGLQVF